MYEVGKISEDEVEIEIPRRGDENDWQVLRMLIHPRRNRDTP